MTYDFTYIVGDVDASEDAFEDRFFEAGCDDAVLVWTNNTLALCFSREAETYQGGVLSAYGDLIGAGTAIVRFEPDYLVNATDIADRSGLSKQSISNYERGLRGSDYPKPYARITSPSPLWDWVDVSRWLCINDRIDEREFRHAQISRIVNIGVQLKSPPEILEAEVANALNEPLAA